MDLVLIYDKQSNYDINYIGLEEIDIKMPKKNSKLAKVNFDNYSTSHISCDYCNKEYLIKNFNKHLKTKTHLNNIKKNKLIIS